MGLMNRGEWQIEANLSQSLTWSDRMQYKNWKIQDFLCPAAAVLASCLATSAVLAEVSLCVIPLPFWMPPPDFTDGSDTELCRCVVMVVDLMDERERAHCTK